MAFLIQLLLFYLAIYFVISGLDDLSVDLRALYATSRRRGRRRREQLPDLRLLRTHPPRKIAIMVPLWNESRVIRDMVETNLRQIDYQNFTFFLGTYRNDKDTVKVATELAERHPNVKIAFCSRPGPTSKADCLNHVYRQMEETERLHGSRFEIVMLHDAEDVLHPASLLLVNWFADHYGMIQVPVLPFPTRLGSWIHGVYCDEFAEFLSRDMPVREAEGAFLPSNGVGTAIERKWLQELQDRQGGVLFDAECLTEDYELGLKLSRAGCRQTLLPMTCQYGDVLATREYFPQTLKAAVRQRSRWISGQCLQAWERHGWPLELKSCYWFWRDRKGLWGNLLSLVGLLTLATTGIAWLVPEMFSLGSWLWLAGSTPGAHFLYPACSIFALERAAVRVALVSRIYGIRFALFAPFRMAISTVINVIATTVALRHYWRSRRLRRRQVWIKTEHAFPAPAQPIELTASSRSVALANSPGGSLPSVSCEMDVTAGLRETLPQPDRKMKHSRQAMDWSQNGNRLRPILLREGELVVEIPRDLSSSERSELMKHTVVRVVYVEQGKTNMGASE